MKTVRASVMRQKSSFTRLLFKFLTCTLLCISLVNADELPTDFVEGKDYSKLVNTHLDKISDLSQLQTISQVEIFYWYGCEPCYQVDAALLDFAEKNPHIEILRTPIVLRPEWRQQAYLQAILDQLPDGQEDFSILDIYRQCLVDCKPFHTVDDSIKWLIKQNPMTDSADIDKDLIWQTEKIYQNRADLFSIGQVPTIIIKESYKVDASQAQTAGRLIKIINHLLSL